MTLAFNLDFLTIQNHSAYLYIATTYTLNTLIFFLMLVLYANKVIIFIKKFSAIKSIPLVKLNLHITPQKSIENKNLYETYYCLQNERKGITHSLDEFKDFWFVSLPDFHSISHGHYDVLSFIFCSMFGTLFCCTWRRKDPNML